LNEIASYRKQRIFGFKQKTPPPKQVVIEVKKTSPSNLDKLEKVESGEAEKIFDLLSKDFEKFIRQNELSDNKYVEYALYKYYTLFLLGDPNPVIQRIGKLFNKKFLDPKKEFIKEIYRIKSLKIERDKKRFDPYTESTIKFFPNLYSDFLEFKRELKEYNKLNFLFSENIFYVKTFLIDKLGQSDFDLFTYFIASYFYQPDIEFKSEKLAESQGFLDTLGSEYVKLNEKYKQGFPDTLEKYNKTNK
jgi:hypothetical protein